MSREWTEEEVRSHFMEHVRIMIKYWAGTHPTSNVPEERTTEERISGFAHSMLAAIDGCSGDLPGFVLAPKFLLAPFSTEEDREYYKEEGKNYYPVNNDDVNCDIAGNLHAQLYQKECDVDKKEY